jgi:hypothetical protein
MVGSRPCMGYASPPTGEGCNVRPRIWWDQGSRAMLHHQLGKGVIQGPASGGIKALGLCFTTNWGRV